MDPVDRSRQHPFESDEVDAHTARVFQAFRRVAKLQRRLMLQTLSERGGGHGEAFCLRALVERDGVTQRDLAALLHLSRPRVTRLLQALEAAGVVARRPDEDDQRLTRVYITDEGRRRERELHAGWADHMNLTIGTLSEWERDTLARLLDKISDRTAEVLGDGEEDDA